MSQLTAAATAATNKAINNRSDQIKSVSRQSFSNRCCISNNSKKKELKVHPEPHRPLTLDSHCYDMGTAIKHPMSDRVKPAVICIFWHLGMLTLRAEHQSAWMSKL